MVGNAEVFEPEIDRRACHFDQRIFPITRGRVAVEGATQVAPLDEIGQFPCLCGGDLPQAVEIAIHIYEIIYALTIKASYLHKKIYELVEDLQEYIDNYDLSITELMNLPAFPEQTRLLEVAQYEQRMLKEVLLPRFQASASTVNVPQEQVSTGNVVVQIPVSKPPPKINLPTTVLKPERNTKRNTMRTSIRKSMHNRPVQMASAAAAGGFKKTRKNNKLKKLKKSYTKSRRALKQSRKHT